MEQWPKTPKSLIRTPLFIEERLGLWRYPVLRQWIEHIAAQPSLNEHSDPSLPCSVATDTYYAPTAVGFLGGHYTGRAASIAIPASAAWHYRDMLLGAVNSLVLEPLADASVPILAGDPIAKVSYAIAALSVTVLALHGGRFKHVRHAAILPARAVARTGQWVGESVGLAAGGLTTAVLRAAAKACDKADRCVLQYRAHRSFIDAGPPAPG